MNLYARFYQALARPLSGRARVVLALLVIPLGLSFTRPLWNFDLAAPQYPEGLRLDIYAHTVEGDVQEVNTLNHYIGMAAIDRAALSDLDWIPFALGVLILLTLRVAAIGNVRWLVDLTVLFVYFSLFSLARFVYKLYAFGHNLDPRAPFQVEPFTPAVLGSKTVANFTTTGYPGGGSWLIAIFALGVVAITGWHLLTGLRESSGKPAPADV